MADFETGGINEAEPCTGTKTAFEVDTQRYQGFGYPFDKTLIAHELRKSITPMNRYMIEIEMLKIAIARLMKGDQDCR